MTVYRILKNLDAGGLGIIQKGEFRTLYWAGEGNITKLKQVGAVAEIHPPPLAILPGWQLRAEKFSKIDVLDAGQFLETNVSALAKAVNVRLKTIDKWKEEIKAFLTINTEQKCCK